MEKILVIGNDARTHSIIWKLKKDNLDASIVCVPGNAGIESIVKCIGWDINDCNGLKDIALSEQPDITIVCPEFPLQQGITNLLWDYELKVFGPSVEAFRLEGSKAFAKNLMKNMGILTPSFQIFTSANEAVDYVKKAEYPLVIKPDGLTAGKGVKVCNSSEEAIEDILQIMVNKIFGQAGDIIIIEEFLKGEGASFIAFTDGVTILPMIPSQDHKRLNDNDEGPNTGGMGAYCPAPIITEELQGKIMDKIIEPIVAMMRRRGALYKGVLYAGIMAVENEPYVLEFNCRFGDPETQALMILLETDLLSIIDAVIKGNLSEVRLSWKKGSAVCIVAAAEGYPENPKIGEEISGLEYFKEDNIQIFHAGTKRVRDKILTDGGRVIGRAVSR